MQPSGHPVQLTVAGHGKSAKTDFATVGILEDARQELRQHFDSILDGSLSSHVSTILAGAQGMTQGVGNEPGSGNHKGWCIGVIPSFRAENQQPLRKGLLADSSRLHFLWFSWAPDLLVLLCPPRSNRGIKHLKFSRG